MCVGTILSEADNTLGNPRPVPLDGDTSTQIAHSRVFPSRVRNFAAIYVLCLERLVHNTNTNTNRTISLKRWLRY